MRYSRELLKGSTDSLLLSLLKQEPMYGYQLIKEIEKRSRGYFRFKEGTIYPALYRLEEQGLIEGRWKRSSKRQERKYYHITERGERLLEAKMAEWTSFSTAVNSVLGWRNAP